MTERRHVLIVEDDPPLRASCRQALEEAGFRVSEAEAPPEAEAILCREFLDLVITDLRMPSGGGEAVLRFAAELSPQIPVIVITAYPSVESAIDVFKQGVVDYILKPFTGEQLLAGVDRALESVNARDHADFLRSVSIKSPGLEEMVGCSQPFNKLLANIRNVASLPAAVLISGETGSGKELIARAVHHLSPRGARKLTALNCAAFPDDLLEAELFGFEKGAFSWAVTSKPGLLEQTEGGTVFLDEVDELSAPSQAKILRVMEEKSGRRVGSVDQRQYDVRFVATTNKILRDEVAAGNFREDLFYRLAVLELTVPPLRDRPEDISRLAVLFLDRLRAESGNEKVVALSEAALERLLEHAWPGNVRELQNVVQKAFAPAKGPLISAEDIDHCIAAHLRAAAAAATPLPRQKALVGFERDYLVAALNRNDGNVTHTAAELGIHRTTLQRLIRKYDIRLRRRSTAAP